MQTCTVVATSVRVCDAHLAQPCLNRSCTRALAIQPGQAPPARFHKEATRREHHGFARPQRCCFSCCETHLVVGSTVRLLRPHLRVLLAVLLHQYAGSSSDVCASAERVRGRGVSFQEGNRHGLVRDETLGARCASRTVATPVGAALPTRGKEGLLVGSCACFTASKQIATPEARERK